MLILLLNGEYLCWIPWVRTSGLQKCFKNKAKCAACCLFSISAARNQCRCNCGLSQGGSTVSSKWMFMLPPETSSLTIRGLLQVDPLTGSLLHACPCWASSPYSSPLCPRWNLFGLCQLKPWRLGMLMLSAERAGLGLQELRLALT